MVRADMLEILGTVQPGNGRRRAPVYVSVHAVFFDKDIAYARSETVARDLGRADAYYYRFWYGDSHNSDDCRFEFFYSDNACSDIAEKRLRFRERSHKSQIKDT